MAKKSKGCDNYSVLRLRSTYKSFLESEKEVTDAIQEIAINLVKGEGYSIDELAGKFRGYEYITEQYEKAREDYERHQERHDCPTPDDLDECF